MSAIEPQIPAPATGPLMDAIVPDRFMQLHTALAGSGLEDIATSQPSAQ